MKFCILSALIIKSIVSYLCVISGVGMIRNWINDPQIIFWGKIIRDLWIIFSLMIRNPDHFEVHDPWFGSFSLWSESFADPGEKFVCIFNHFDLLSLIRNPRIKFQGSPDQHQWSAASGIQSQWSVIRKNDLRITSFFMIRDLDHIKNHDPWFESFFPRASC